MKRILLILFVIGFTASTTAMAAMSNSRVRKETRFLTDKMAHELNMNTNQYNDAYEINFDFIYSVRYLMDDVVRGQEWALDDYYRYLDVRNDDLRWVLSDSQYRRFLQMDYFYRPIYASGGGWNFRVYITYTNHNHFYFGRPYHYRSYCGGHYRTHYNNRSYYQGRYNHSYYRRTNSVRDDRVYQNNRRSDFGSVSIRPNTSTRPSTATRPSTSTRPSGTSSSRRSSSSSNRTEGDRVNTGTSTTNSSSSRRNSGASSTDSSRRTEGSSGSSSTTNSNSSNSGSRRNGSSNDNGNSSRSSSRKEVSTPSSSSSSSRSSSSSSSSSSRGSSGNSSSSRSSEKGGGSRR